MVLVSRPIKTTFFEVLVLVLVSTLLVLVLVLVLASLVLVSVLVSVCLVLVLVLVSEGGLEQLRPEVMCNCNVTCIESRN